MPQNNKQRAPKGGSKASLSNKTITDPRFSNIQTDPRYRLPSRKHTHVKLDSRFAHMLRDDDFAKKSSVDRYGRRIPKGQGKKELERFYDIDNEEQEADDEEDVRKELQRVGRTYDPAREGGFSESSSDDDESISADEEVEDELDITGGVELDGGLGAQEEEEVPMGEPSARIAIVNLDWDNIRAVDLMAVATSFCPPDGRIIKVTVYPSAFGKERMEREELEGPPPELFTSDKADSQSSSEPDDATDATSEEDEDKDEQIKASLLAESTADAPEVNTRALRAYQLSRLRYYYAILISDSSATASALYNAMDGREYLSTANFFDMRFVPDSVSFNDPVTDRPRDECTRVPDGYRPNDFVTEALTHSKVRLTWDEEDPGRKEIQKRAFSRQEVDENDLKAYVGSDSDSDASSSPAPPTISADPITIKPTKVELARQKMRAALGLSTDTTTAKPSKRSEGKGDRAKQQPVGDMQITFSAGLSAAAGAPRASVFENRPEDVVEETTRERYIRKERERKARRKAKAKAGREGEDGEMDTEDIGNGQADVEAGAQAARASGEGEEDDPFNDPFFADPASANAAAKKAAKAAKRAEAAKEAEAASERKQREREELELLMVGDGGVGADLGGRGFDMAAIKKAEKAAARKGAKKGRKGRKVDVVGDRRGGEEDGGAGFEINVKDPRFAGVFESHEFAIDPSHPRFSGTEGMKRLLEEGRRKRKVRAGEEGGEELVTGKKKGEGKGIGGGDPEGLEELVKKVKKRKAV